MTKISAMESQSLIDLSISPTFVEWASKHQVDLNILAESTMSSFHKHLKQSLACENCHKPSKTCLQLYNFAHVNSEDKHECIRSHGGDHNLAIDTLLRDEMGKCGQRHGLKLYLDEIAKCRFLCVVCHIEGDKFQHYLDQVKNLSTAYLDAKTRFDYDSIELIGQQIDSLQIELNDAIEDFPKLLPEIRSLLLGEILR
jgi:hypothetical protein